MILFLTSYHHVLKDYWLDGKRNRRVDHLIHALVKDMIPSYEDRHKQQKLGMQGPNLAEKHQKDILARASETTQERIQQSKHIAATVHFFGGGIEGAGPHAPVNASEELTEPAHKDGSASKLRRPALTS